jgi:bacteriophage HK97-gp10 putative tail-component
LSEIKITLKVKGKEELKKVLQRMEDAVSPKGLDESVQKGAEVFVEVLKEVAPKETGALAGSVDSVKKEEADYSIGPNKIYDRIQDLGGTIHGNPFLVWEGEEGLIFARSVTIPAQHYMLRAFEEGKDAAAAAVIEDVISKLKG